MTPHGAFFWNELMTRSVEKSKAFYGETLDWEYLSHPDGGRRRLHGLQGRRGRWLPASSR